MGLTKIKNHIPNIYGFEAIFYVLFYVKERIDKCSYQWSGRFLDIIGWDSSVCKSNRLHVDILPFSFTKLGVYSINSFKTIDIFSNNLELQPVISQTQLDRL